MTTWLPMSISPPKDGTQFLAAQNGEVFVARYETSITPPQLVFRQHRNRVDRHYRYATVLLDGEMVDAEIPVDKPWKETWESVWRIGQRGFKFNPGYWMPLEPLP